LLRRLSLQAERSALLLHRAAEDGQTQALVRALGSDRAAPPHRRTAHPNRAKL